MSLEVAGFILGLVGAVVSFIAIVVSIVVSWRTTRAASFLPIELALLSEFRSVRAREERRIVIRLGRREDLGAGGFEAQTREVREAAVSVAHFYDHVGLLVSRGHVRRDAFVQFMGVSAHQCWTSLKEIVRHERCERGNDAHLRAFEKFGTLKLPADLQLSYDKWAEERG